MVDLPKLSDYETDKKDFQFTIPEHYLVVWLFCSLLWGKRFMASIKLNKRSVSNFDDTIPNRFLKIPQDFKHALLKDGRSATKFSTCWRKYCGVFG